MSLIYAVNYNNTVERHRQLWAIVSTVVFDRKNCYMVLSDCNMLAIAKLVCCLNYRRRLAFYRRLIVHPQRNYLTADSGHWTDDEASLLSLADIGPWSKKDFNISQTVFWQFEPCAGDGRRGQGKNRSLDTSFTSSSVTYLRNWGASAGRRGVWFQQSVWTMFEV